MISISVAGTSYDVPSSAADVDWAADQIAFEQALASAINTRTPTMLTPSPFTNSWQNKGSGFQTTRYYKDQWGQVHLEGCISTGADGSVAFTLASGYRPVGAQSFLCVSAGGVAAIDIATTGTVTINQVSGNVSTFTSLCGISFNVNS